MILPFKLLVRPNDKVVKGWWGYSPGPAVKKRAWKDMEGSEG